jgi:hypothetical protein
LEIGGRLFTVPTAYTTEQGVHVALNGYNLTACSGHLIAIRIAPGAPPHPEVAWCSPAFSLASPISTTTDGRHDAVLWTVIDDQLHAFDGDTGAVLFDGGGEACANVRMRTSPIAVKGRLVAGGDGHLCSWSAR